MYSSSLFEHEEKITRTEMIEKLMNAKECAFTVTFRKKVKAEDVAETLKNIKSQAALNAQQKSLSKQLCEGQLTTLTSFLVKTEEKLGRSAIIDLESPYGHGYRLVDHRTIEELVLKNTKFTLKK
jgi:hypothetical protein